MKGKSQAYKFVEFLFQHALSATVHSWLRMNQSLHGAVSCAIEGGLRFSGNDFERFVDCLRGGYWLGAEPEGFFTTAVRVGNMSAVHSFENWQQRKGYILDGERMVVGRRFQYGKYFVECTSIRSDCFIAVERKGWRGRSERIPKDYDKIIRRFKITQEDLKSLRASLREKAKSE